MSILIKPLQPFLDYLDQIKPDYRATLKGDPVDILRLNENHTNHPLPKLYESFIRVMGLDVGPDLFPKWNFSTRDISRWYGGAGPLIWPVEDHFQPIAFPREGEMYWFLALDQPVGEDDAVVFQAEGGQNLEAARQMHPRFKSLNELLYFEAFTRIHLKKWGTQTHILRTTCTAPETAAKLEHFDQIFHRAGFSPLAGTGDQFRRYEREDLLVALNRDLSQPRRLAVYLAGADEKQVEVFINMLLEHHPFNRAQV